jgi:hypothetical protein
MSRAAELGEAGEEDRAEGQGEAKQDLHDEQGPELTVVGVDLEGRRGYRRVRPTPPCSWRVRNLAAWYPSGTPGS